MLNSVSVKHEPSVYGPKEKCVVDTDVDNEVDDNIIIIIIL